MAKHAKMFSQIQEYPIDRKKNYLFEKDKMIKKKAKIFIKLELCDNDNSKCS